MATWQQTRIFSPLQNIQLQKTKQNRMAFHPPHPNFRKVTRPLPPPNYHHQSARAFTSSPDLCTRTQSPSAIAGLIESPSQQQTNPTWSKTTEAVTQTPPQRPNRRIQAAILRRSKGKVSIRGRKWPKMSATVYWAQLRASLSLNASPLGQKHCTIRGVVVTR